jgi:hypothetical protein
MHRLTARFLLLFALAGNLAPFALAASIPAPHACCVRKAAHHCHSAAALESDQLTIQAPTCCGHDCCRAVAPGRWAYARIPAQAFVADVVTARDTELYPNPPARVFSDLRSSRAPPVSILG